MGCLRVVAMFLSASCTGYCAAARPNDYRTIAEFSRGMSIADAAEDWTRMEAGKSLLYAWRAGFAR